MDACRTETIYSKYYVFFYPSNIFNYREKNHLDIVINFNFPSTETNSDVLIKTDIYSTHPSFFLKMSALSSLNCLRKPHF